MVLFQIYKNFNSNAGCLEYVMFSKVFLLEYTSSEVGNIYDIFLLIQQILRADAESFPLQNISLM